ncbi:hypothetical protein [Vibrio coralliilyticus]|uniref:hypothetical protein n=1 Tax=Vibrio coralliilyticus TaxID=190893 RepID=UPI00148D1121|nr:hypothetical protein [Vibrio coralliilyticus]NOI32209.1 hypothetical protein [Vibrio coralliilyticus]NOI51386.1 hypothetical protein [Vibrio coralliilyticus]
MLPKYKDIVDLLKKGSTIEAQEQIMSLREGALELQEENHELKERVRELELVVKNNENWDMEKKRYMLVNPWRGPAQVYALKESESQGERPHFICTNCFHQSQKAILSPVVDKGDTLMNCPRCKASLNTGFSRIGPAIYAEKINKVS